MSHELRTPLNGILGLTALIEQETLGPLGHERYAEYVRIIGSSGRHLVTVINDVLDYSKIEAGMLELDPVAFDLSQMTGSVVELLASSAHEKAIELGYVVAPEVPVNLIGDPERFSRSAWRRSRPCPPTIRRLRLRGLPMLRRLSESPA